jgi:hypothetical protein
VLDADLRDFFTSLDHGWLQKFLEHRIVDKRVLRLIGKWVSAEVIEDGAWMASEVGAPKGRQHHRYSPTSICTTSWTGGSGNGNDAKRVVT